MSRGYIDSASIYGIVQVLSYQKPEDCFGWAWQSALQVSTALIGTSHLAISPAPGQSSTASGPYGELTHGLAHFVETNEYRPRVSQIATVKTKHWALEHLEAIQSTYEQLKADPVNFAQWREWLIIHEWQEHAQRLYGLFNPEFIPQIAQILKADESVVREAWILSCDPQIVTRYVKKQPDEDIFGLTRDAFVVAALLRGWHHEYIAQRSSWQIMHHPMRSLLLPGSKKKIRTEFPSLTAQYLANIILAGSFAEGKQKRIARFVENIEKARKAEKARIIDLGAEEDEEVALKLAIQAAKKADISTHPRWLEKVLDASLSVGVGVITSFLLTPWEGLLVGTAAYLPTLRVSPGGLATEVIFERKSRLRDLATAAPGRIEQTWRK